MNGLNPAYDVYVLLQAKTSFFIYYLSSRQMQMMGKA